MKKYVLYGLMALSLVITSCEKFLDMKPQSEIPTEDLFKTENGFEDALMGCYVKMTSDDLYGRFLTLEGVDFMAQYYDKAPSSSIQRAFKDFNYKHLEAEAQIKSTYNAFYNAILHANQVIEHIEAPGVEKVIKSEKKRNLIKGEALGLRAFLHFDLQRLFGQLPKNAKKLVSLPYSEITGVEDRPLYAFEDYMNKVLEDLNMAEKYLAEDPAITHNIRQANHEDITDDFFQFRRLRMNYFAVQALQARVYLYIGENQKAYEKAKQLVEYKEGNSTKNYFHLAGNEDMDKGYYTLPSETLFGLSSAQLEGNEYQNLFVNPSGSLSMLFPKRKRLQMFANRMTASNNRFNKLWSEYSATTGSTVDRYLKYIHNDGYVSDNQKLEFRWNYPLIRFSEIYLIMMETSENLDEINKLFVEYMAARNEQPSLFKDMESVKQTILDEYRIEFMAEGQMFFTYKRFGAEKMLWRWPKVSEENYIIPVPLSEIIN